MRKHIWFAVFLAVTVLVTALAFAAAEEAPKPVTDITLSETEVTLIKGSSMVLSAEISPEDAANPKVEWSSSDENVATVARGKITGKNAGKCDIICSAADESGAQAVCHVEVRIPVKGIAIGEKKITLLTGASEKDAEGVLTYTVTPEDAFWQDVVWTSSDETTVTVSADGTVRGLKPGKAVVTASSTQPESKVTAQAQVVVQQAVTGIRLDKDSLTLSTGTVGVLKTEISPADAGNKALEWSSSDETVATVRDGKIRAKECGECDITCRATDGSGIQTVCRLTVIKMVKSIRTQNNVATIPYAGTFQTEVTIAPADATNPVLKWESSDTNICTVDENGTIYGAGPGNCVVTAETTDGSDRRISFMIHVNCFGIYMEDDAMYVDENLNGYVLVPDGYPPEQLRTNETGRITAAYTTPFSFTVSGYPWVTVARRARLTFIYQKDRWVVDIPVKVKRDEYKSGDYYYFVNEDDSATITFFNGESIGEIPSELDGHPVTALADYAFRGKKGTKIVIPDSVRSIGMECFATCRDAREIILSENLEYIGKRAFGTCSRVKELRIPASVKFIDESPIRECISLQKLTVDEGNAFYTVQDDGLIDRRGNVLVCYPVTKDAKDLSVLKKVNSIGNYALADFSVKKLVVPENIRYIGACAFHPDLEEVELKGVEIIGDNAFISCRLLNITLPETLKKIGCGAFAYTDTLTEIRIPAGVKTIDQNAFTYMTGRRYIVPKGSYAEKYCKRQELEYITEE